MFDRLAQLLKPGRRQDPMQPESLVRDGKPLADAISAAPADAAPLKPLLAAPEAGVAAAAAIIAGAKNVTALTADLAAQLGREGLPGRAAAWALGRLGAQRELLAAIESGGLDQRDNAYAGIAVLAAVGKADASLGATLRARVETEIAKAKSGGTGLGEHAVRALAVLGDAQAATLAQAVVDGDRFCDRFELQRIKKAVADGGRHGEAVKLFGASWQEFFADQLAPPEVAKPAAPAAKPAVPAKAPAAPAQPTSYMDEADALGVGAPADGEPADVDPAAAAVPPAAAGAPVDWKAFLASPEVAALAPQLKQLASQLCPLLEQLAARAIQAHLTDLNRDEFAALLLQVMPQALPPQHVQAALSPQAMICYQAMAKYFIRTKAATQGDALLEGVRFVRKAMTEQIKRAGILNGPDYSDPDEKPAKSPLITT